MLSKQVVMIVAIIIMIMIIIIMIIILITLIKKCHSYLPKVIYILS